MEGLQQGSFIRDSQSRNVDMAARESGLASAFFVALGFGVIQVPG